MAFFITVTRRRNNSNSGAGKGSSFSNDNGGGKYSKEDDENTEDDKGYDEYGESLSSSSSFTSSNEERVAVIGAMDAFGGWDSECLQLVQTPNDAEKWTGKIDLSDDAAFSKTELKLVLLDQFQNVIQCGLRESFYVELPERCVKYEITVDWPIDDERLTASSTAKVEVKASENKIETGGAWLAWDGQKPSAKQMDAMNDSSEEGEKEEVVEATTMMMMMMMMTTTTTTHEKEGKSEIIIIIIIIIINRVKMMTTTTTLMAKIQEEKKAKKMTAQRLSNDLAVELGYSPRVALERYQNRIRNRNRLFRRRSISRSRRTDWRFRGRRTRRNLVRTRTEVGKGMRVGDVYISTVARVMKGMNALLVDLTGKGPPYALLQKGVDSPAMAWKTKLIGSIDRTNARYR